MSKVLISSSSRYSIYKVQTLSCSSQRLSYLSTSCRICQVLFTSFSNSFVQFAVLPAVAVHRTTLLSYHRTFRLSRTFLIFFKLFSVDRCPRRQLAYISTCNPICQALFYNFRNSFLLSLTMYSLSSNWYISPKKQPRIFRSGAYAILYTILY